MPSILRSDGGGLINNKGKTTYMDSRKQCRHPFIKYLMITSFVSHGVKKYTFSPINHTKIMNRGVVIKSLVGEKISILICNIFGKSPMPLYYWLNTPQDSPLTWLSNEKVNNNLFDWYAPKSSRFRTMNLISFIIFDIYFRSCVCENFF